MVENVRFDEEIGLVLLEFERSDETAVDIENLEMLLRQLIALICDVYNTAFYIALNRVATNGDVQYMLGKIGLISERIEKALEIAKKIANKMGIQITP